MRIKTVTYKLLSHIFLIISLILIFFSFVYKDWNIYQYQIISIAVAVYLGSSMIYHYFDKTLTLEVGLEYILIALLAFLVVFGIVI